MYKCNFCGFSSDSLESFEEDTQFRKGYWCPCCDGFTYFQQQEHHFKLVLEQKGIVNKTQMSKGKVAHRSSIKCQISPLRWPGGKSKVISDILDMCVSAQMEHFVEPFAGGASVGLALLAAGIIKELYLNDKDYGIYALFQVIKDKPDELIHLVNNFEPTQEAYKQAQYIVKSKYAGCDLLAAAWNLLVTNRLSFSGIVKANCMRDPAARWNPDTLKKRIITIHSFGEHIHVSNTDACEYIEKMYWLPNTTLFIDPPYFEKGKQLYTEYYTEADHSRLATLLDNLYKGMPGADIILTYDDSEYIRKLYEFPNVEFLERNYSIANHAV